MKVKIKSFNGELPDYLTLGKVYDCFVNFGDISFEDNYGERIYIDLENCCHLSGGSWEVVERPSKNMKIKINKKQSLDEVVETLKSKGIDCCNYSFDGKVRVIYVSEIANEAYGAYKSSIDMDFLFTRELTTLAELKEM